MDLQPNLASHRQGEGWIILPENSPPHPHSQYTYPYLATTTGLWLIPHCMTLTFSDTVIENCDSILVLSTDYISLDRNDENT